MKTRFLVVTSILALASLAVACGDDDDPKGSGGTSGSGGTAASGGTSGSGGAGGTSGGTAGTAGTAGTGGGAPACGTQPNHPSDACVGLEDAYAAQYEGRSIGTIAQACARSTECIGLLRTPDFTPCVQECIDAETNNAIADNSCSACVVITVECGATACIGKCLSDKDECGPNGDESCCAECMCQNGAYAALEGCTGIPNDTCAVFE